MFTGLAALISALTGMLGGSIPKIFEIVDRRLNFAQEVKIRELEEKFRQSEHERQVKMAELSASAKIEESYYEAVKAEVAANAQTMVEAMRSWTEPTQYAWLNALNASLRPFFFLTTILLFFAVIAQVLLTTPEALSAQAASQFWIACEGVIGWICGYRSVIKPPVK